MPIGAGQNIGTAYVRVVVDGKDFDLSDLFDDTEGEMGKQGRRASKAYQEAWREEFESGPSKKAFDDAIRKSLVSGDTAKAFVNSAEWQRFRAGLEKEYGDIGRRAGENLSQEIENGIDVSSVEGRISNLRRDLIKAERQLNAEAQRERENEFRKHLANIEALREEDLRNFKATALQASAIRENELRDIARERKARADGALLERAYTLNRIFDMNREIAMQRELAMLTRAYAMNDKFDIEQRKLALDNLTKSMRRQRDSIMEVADAVGVAFGRGSRNNFLNFTGSVARNVIGLGARLIDLGGLVRKTKLIFDAAGGGVAGFRAAIGSLSGIARGAALGLAGLFTIIGPLTSILSGLGGMILAVASSMGAALLGAISALSSTLAFGLAGAAGIGAASFVPLVAGIGVFALAVANADKETKKAFRSIGREFSDLGEVAATATFGNITEQTERFKAVIGDLSPLVRGIGVSISEIGDAWLTLLEGPGFRQFQKAITDFLPGAVRSLGIAIGQAAAGLGGLFRALIPQTGVFLDWLVEITRRFQIFANSANGQRSLRNFFADAAASAAELGSFLSAVGTLLGEVFEQANAPGDNLFRSMTRGLLDWADALDRNPDIMRGWNESMEAFGGFVGSARDLLLELVSAGRGVGDSLFGSLAAQIDRATASIRANPRILADWYDSAAAFARVLGDVVLGLGRVFSALDNTFSRSLLAGTFTILANAIGAIASAMEGIASLFGGAAGAVQSFAGQVAAAAIVLPVLTKALGVSAITSWVASLKTAETRLASLGTVARGAAGIGGLLAFSAGAEESNRTASLLMQTLGGAGLGFSLGGPWGALIGGAAGLALGAFSDSAKEAGDSSAVAAPKVTDFASTFDSVTQAATGATRALALQRLEEEGATDAAAKLGIANRDLVLASLGNADAQRRVNAAMQLASQKYSAAASGGKEVSDANKELFQALLDVRRELPFLSKEFREQQRQAREAYLSSQDLSALYKSFPKKLATAIDLQGVAPTLKGVASVARQYDLTPKQVKTLMSVIGVDFTMREINRVKQNLDETGRKKPKPQIDIDPSAFKRGATDVNKALDAVGRVVKTPKINVDTGSSVADTNAVKNSIDALPTQKTITITTQYRVVGNAGDALPDRTPRTAAGGIFYGAQNRIIAEAGKEAVVPLARNLSQVDPSVRLLSAFAQGKLGDFTGTGGSSKTVDVGGITIITPTKDPEAVANEAINRLVGAGY